MLSLAAFSGVDERIEGALYACGACEVEEELRRFDDIPGCKDGALKALCQLKANAWDGLIERFGQVSNVLDETLGGALE